MKKKKIILFSILVCSFLFICVLIPTLAKLVTSKNNINNEWDGSIASSFNSGEGTIDSPYIISNASEFAYFKESLKKDDYENKYFKITDDIIINAGLFKEDEELEYIKDDTIYYLDTNTNKYYEGSSFENYVGSINEFEMLSTFKGFLDGGNHTIYGLFIDGDNSSLFDSIGGSINNLIIENAYIYGEYSSSGLALNSNDSTINNVIIDGNILSGNDSNDDTNISAGLIINANNSNIEKVVNRANVENKIASGLIGISNNTNITKSYNLGNINGETSSGIVDTITSSESSLSYVYNEGTLTNKSSGLVSNIIDSIIEIRNSYNSFNTNALGRKENSNITITNSYNKISNEEFLTYNKNAIKELFNDNEFFYDDIPLTKLDYETQKYVNIVLKNNVWNTFKENVDYISYDEDLSFILVSTKDYKAIKNVYYYLSEDELTKDDLETVNWTDYDKPIDLNKKGIYILYVKLVNYNDEVNYLNTDRVYLYVDNIYASIKVDDKSWDELHSPSYVFINNKKVEIKAYSINDIKSIKYLVTSDILDSNDLVETTSWINYQNPINIKNDSIIYVKVEDKNSNIIYLNSDLFIDTKYSISNLKSGGNLKFNSNMTYNSSISFDVELDNENVTLDGFTRSIVSNEVLPVNTHIVISDITRNKVYEYSVTELTGKEIALNKFREVGLIIEKTYSNEDTQKEKFNIIIDFKNIEETNKEYNIYFKAKRVSEELTSNVISFKLNSLDEINSNLSITSGNNISTINYNSSSITNVKFNTSFNGEYLNTNLEDLDKVLIIEVLDKNGSVVNKDNYKGLKFIYNSKNYSSNNANKTLIKLEEINNTSETLVIKTSEDINRLLDDDYVLKISLGLAVNNLIKYHSNNSINIPIVINKNNLNRYGFNISTDKRIVSATNLFKIKVSSSIDNPTIKVSLYKKKERNATNQEYTEVNISDYINESIESISKGETQVSFKDGVEKNSYMFKFSLYDGEDFVGENSIKVVVR